jgi:glycosyltransferase A (GT-A) superfamily protein (DUF2064 family)
MSATEPSPPAYDPPTPPDASRSKTALLLFARAPARERKATGLRRYDAHRLHHALLLKTLDTLRAASQGAPLLVSTDDPRALAPHAPSATLLSQRGASFEDKLLDAFQQAASLGYERVVLVGSDIPGLCPLDLARALDAPQAALGPSADGGFYLLTLDLAHTHDALRGLPWGRANLAQHLHARLRALRLDVALLPTRQDVDNPRDVRQTRALLDDAALDFLGAPLELPPAPSRAPSPDSPRAALRLRGLCAWVVPRPPPLPALRPAGAGLWRCPSPASGRGVGHLGV